MSRSSKKGPYIDQNILDKIKKGGNQVIKTYARMSSISPEFVGRTFDVHNGRKFISVYVTEDMVGHKLGEFAPTRTFKGHGRVVKRVIEKT
ncbi:MAG TPA: 30S ribosomal protein S19 [Candidatus Woesebacteria bacterium]|jgi:small subunit ribosomal protein S19|nr:30S ribosomal protein S19 [Candidatus Shapirobacteria bacterium]HOR01856.1 30S ribosomal protein S19 [Candidatus Woesebacteria bacterium]